jgi:hypothetical protein
MSSKSPFSGYLHTNYTPTSEEKVAIEALCADPLRDIQQLDEEIDKLEEEMARLRLRREELQTFVDDHRMLLSPIRQLSPEVLQRIFVECVAAHCYADCHPVMLSAQAPMLLGRVCSFWRRVAYGTAELWNRLHIAIPNPDKSDVDGALTTLRLEALKDWLGRTGSLPLHISLFATPPPRTTPWSPEMDEEAPTIHDYGHIYQYAEALAEFADRWANLTLYHVPPPLLRPWSVLSGHALPMLKGVRLSYNNAGSWSDEHFYEVNYLDYQVLEFLRHAPLESVTLLLHSTVHIPAFRKDTLTYLNIQSGLAFSDGQSLASFFSGFIGLRTLHFKLVSEGTSFSWSVGRIIGEHRSDSDLVTLSYLEELNVSGFGDDLCSIVDFWHHLRVPKLQSMTFQLDPSKPAVTNGHGHGIFARFMHSSQCSTLSINYYTFRLNSDDNSQSQEPHHIALMPYIRACTQVTDLTVRFGSPVRSYYDAYPPPMSFPNAGEGLLRDIFLEGDVSLLPRLRNLTLHSELPTLTSETLEDITQSRADSSLGSAQVPLECLEFHSPTPIEDSLRSQFGDGYSRTGTKIVIQAPIAPEPYYGSVVRTSPYAGLPGYTGPYSPGW